MSRNSGYLEKPALCRDFKPALGYVTWLAVPPEWSEVHARDAFRERYRREPGEVRMASIRRVRLKKPKPFRAPGAWLVGPVFTDEVPPKRCSWHQREVKC